MPDYGSSREAQAKAAEILARARQGDPQAINQLYVASREGGWRPGDRNAAVQAWNALTPGEEDNVHHIDRSHGFLGDVGEKIGSGLKILAPFAGLIPGVGPLAGMALGAGGEALGRGLHHDKFSLLDTALAGGAGYLGGKANPFGSHTSIPGAPDISGMGDTTYAPGGGGGPSLAGFGPGQYAGGLPTGGGSYADPGMGGGGGGGILDRVLGGGGGGGWLDKALKYGPLVAGGISNANRQHESDQMMQDAIRGSKADWASRAPLRAQALAGLQGLPGLQAPDLSAIFADPGNVYNKVNPLTLTSRYRQ